MNFESELKLLAEKRPETFRIDRAGGIEWNTTKGWHTSPIDFLTQDDLDEIAALLQRRVIVQPAARTDGGFTDLVATIGANIADGLFYESDERDLLRIAKEQAAEIKRLEESIKKLQLKLLDTIL